MDFDEALRYLLSLGHETVAIKLGLENTERLLRALGSPQDAFPAVQIAGTNGKGSTAALLDRICRAAGIKTGIYTSPHLISITERIRTGSLEITPEQFARLLTLVAVAARNLVDRGELITLPTFFEHVTATALMAFRESGVRLAILEAGLGGRLDATTVARAETVAITPIALDHQEYLGRTLAEIAAEKAAIIRPGVKTIVAPQPPEALEVILKRCAANGVTPRLVDSEIKVIDADESGRLRANFKTGTDYYERVRVSLRGRHQLTNAATAITIAETLSEGGLSISRDAVREGVERAEHKGRLELWEGRPSILFDGAHNAAGARALRAYLDEFCRQRPITLIFGAMRDKALDEIAATLFPAAARIILTKPDMARAAEPEEVARVAVPTGADSSKITLARVAHEALKAARAQTPPLGLICITGSLYLVGELQRILLDERAAHPRTSSEH